MGFFATGGDLSAAVVPASFPCRLIDGCCYGWYDQIVWFLEVCFLNCSIRRQGGTTLATSAPTTNTSARLDMDTCANAHQCFTEATPINTQCCAGIIGSALLFQAVSWTWVTPFHAKADDIGWILASQERITLLLILRLLFASDLMLSECLILAL